MRPQFRRWEQAAVALDRLEPADDPDVQRIAELAESLPHSRVLHLGYGKGEAVLVAHQLRPDAVKPLASHACRFTAEGLRGQPGSPDLHDAVRARNDVLAAVRDIVATRPKSLPPDS